MVTFKTFEDIEVWQKARILTNELYMISNHGPFGKDFGLRDQIRRASISIMSNIAEGFERDGTKEFIQFLAIAKGSVGEVRSHLYVALDQKYISKDKFNQLNESVREISRMITGLIKYLKGSNIKGTKYKKEPIFVQRFST